LTWRILPLVEARVKFCGLFVAENAMNFLDLNTTSITVLQQQLPQYPTIVACLCAAWCDVCSAYRIKFEELSTQLPELLFLWVDIEDQAELVGDFEVENFPTLLVQHNQTVTFYGSMQPEINQLKRLLQSQHQPMATATIKQQAQQSEVNLIHRLMQPR
jgi:thioredoxin 1